MSKPLTIGGGAMPNRISDCRRIAVTSSLTGSRTPRFKDEGHDFRKKTNADFQFYATVVFMRQYLLPGTKPQTSCASEPRWPLDCGLRCMPWSWHLVFYDRLRS